MSLVKKTFSIKDLENLSGIKAHTIRIWEKRYNLLSPERTKTNIRMYSLLSLQKLLNITLLYENGLKISKIAQLKNEEIPLKVREIIDEKSVKNNMMNAFKLSMINFDQNLFYSTYNQLVVDLSFREIFKEYLKLLKLDKYPLKVKGWPLPFGNYLDRPSYKNAFLIGDAANLVDPLTGEGLCYAHKSAQIVSQVIIENQKDTQMIPNLYNERINEEIINKLKKAKIYRSILWSSPKMLYRILVSFGAKYFHKRITNIIQGYSVF